MTTWAPILPPNSNIAALAWDAIQGIAQTVMASVPELSAQVNRRLRRDDEALLYAYLALADNNFDLANRAIECLNLAIDEAGQSTPRLDLFGGLSGLGWTVEHLSHLLQQFFGPTEKEEEDLNSEIDALILTKLQHARAYDLVSGLVGLGVYFLERWPKPTAVQGIRAVFYRLEELAEHTADGITWRTGTEFLPDWQVKRCPNGYYNLGVAHGVPGIIQLLAQISGTMTVEPNRLFRLLEGAVSWIIAQQRPQGTPSRFPSWVAPGDESLDGRLAWCYGDLGILAMLLGVARHAQRKDWQDFAHDLLDHCLAWPPDEGNVNDAPLCHGAAGVAHIFNRIYQSEGDLRCRDSAIFWFNRALGMRKPETGIGGFSVLTQPDPDGKIIWDANPAFLDGSIGIALALLSAVSSIEPQWDRLLLLSEKTCRATQPAGFD